jgi:hypothetical protein
MVLNSVKENYSNKNFDSFFYFPAITMLDNETKSSNNRSSSIDNDSSTSLISKAERDQEMQKYYRADLIQHLTDWRSTQLEKQV